MFTSPASRQTRRRSFTNVNLLDSIAGSFNGSTTTFNLTLNGAVVKPSSALNLEVVLGGIQQQPIVAYTVSGSSITFATAPATNETCFIIMSQTAGMSQMPAFGVIGSSVLLTNVIDQTISGGANVTPNSLGTFSSGTLTVDCGKCPLQYATNNGAFTIAAPTLDGSTIILLTNGASAGAITFSGFTTGTNIGDPLSTTNTSKFMLFISRINGVSYYYVCALQ
jgi:hypothetical protein